MYVIKTLTVIQTLLIIITQLGYYNRYSRNLFYLVRSIGYRVVDLSSMYLNLGITENCYTSVNLANKLLCNFF